MGHQLPAHPLASEDAVRRAFGANVRQVRGGRTQIDAARACGMNQSALSKIERGHVNPTLTTVVRLAVGLGCSATALIRFMDQVVVIAREAREEEAA